jgi:ABC-2 type transport system permease protein
MTKLRAIVRQEWRHLWSDGTAPLILVTLGLCVGYAVHHGSQIIRSQRATLDQFLRVEKKEVDLRRDQNARTWIRIDRGELKEIDEWTNDPKLTPLLPSWDFQLQRSAVQPFSSLAFLSLGQSDAYPEGYKPYSPGRYFKETITSVEQATNPARMMTGHFDLSFVILYLLPLFVIAVSYDLTASDKESGLLPLVLAQPVLLRTIVLIKIAVRAVLILGATLLLVLAAIALTSIDWQEAGTIPLLAAWICTALAYIVFWFGLALIVNSRGRGPAANAVILAACWLALVLLLPAAARFAAKAAYPIPPRAELRNLKRDAIMQTGVDLWEQGVKQLDDEDSLTSRLVGRFLAENPDIRMADLPLSNQKLRFRLFDYSEPDNVRNYSPKWKYRPYIQRFELVNAARSAEIEKIIKPAQEHFDRQYRKQHSVYGTMSVLSPEMLAEHILSYLSRTTPEQHERFLQQVEQTHREWKRYFLKRSLSMELLRSEDYDHFPYFQYQQESPLAVLKNVSRSLIWLLGMSILLNVAGIVRFRRFQVIGS